MVRTLVVVFWGLAGGAALFADEPSQFFDAAGNIFPKYVKNGPVDDGCIQRNSRELSELRSRIALFPLSGMKPLNMAKAGWLHADHLPGIQGGIEIYPVAQPRQINDIPDLQKYPGVGGWITSGINPRHAADFAGAGDAVWGFIHQYRQRPIPSAFVPEDVPYEGQLTDVAPSLAEPASSRPERPRAYTPSRLLRKGELEFKHFNNLYTQTAFFDADYSKISQGSRSTFFASLLSLLYGERDQLNIGLDLLIKAVRNDREGSSPFALFRFANDANGRVALTHAAPKFKFIPLRRFPRLALQTSLLFPLSRDLDGAEQSDRPFLDVDGFQWWLQLLWDAPLHSHWLIYVETGTFVRFSSDFYTPVKILLNYYPAERWTLYGIGEISPFWSREGLSALFTQAGMGMKYEVSRHVELEVLFTRFLYGKNQGAGQTFNFGWRLIH